MILFGTPPQPVARKISGCLPYMRSGCAIGELQGQLLSDFCSSGKTLREQRNQSAMAANNTCHLPEAAARKTSGFPRMHLPFIHTFIRCLLSTYHMQTLYCSLGNPVNKMWPNGKVVL